MWYKLFHHHFHLVLLRNHLNLLWLFNSHSETWLFHSYAFIKSSYFCPINFFRETTVPPHHGMIRSVWLSDRGSGQPGQVLNDHKQSGFWLIFVPRILVFILCSIKSHHITEATAVHDSNGQLSFGYRRSDDGPYMSPSPMRIPSIRSAPTVSNALPAVPGQRSPVQVLFSPNVNRAVLFSGIFQFSASCIGGRCGRRPAGPVSVPWPGWTCLFGRPYVTFVFIL